MPYRVRANNGPGHHSGQFDPSSSLAILTSIGVAGGDAEHRGAGYPSALTVPRHTKQGRQASGARRVCSLCRTVRAEYKTAPAPPTASRRGCWTPKASEPDGRTRPRNQVQALLESILRPQTEGQWPEGGGQVASAAAGPKGRCAVSGSRTRPRSPRRCSAKNRRGYAAQVSRAPRCDRPPVAVAKAESPFRSD